MGGRVSEPARIPPPETITADEIAARLQISKTAAYALMHRLGAIRCGTALVSKRTRFEGWLAMGGDVLPPKPPTPIDVAARRLHVAHPHALYRRPCTYIVAADAAGLVKIGRSKKFPKRYESLAAGSPVPLSIVAIFRDWRFEERLHEHFAEHRAHAEWFAAAPVLTWLRAAKVLSDV